MHKTGIHTVYVISTGLKLEITTNGRHRAYHTGIQVLNSKLEISLLVSVTSSTILTAKRTIHKNT